MPRRGYRLNAEVDDGAAPARLNRGVALLIAAVVPVVVGAAFAAWLLIGAPEPERPTRDYSLAILPFEVYRPLKTVPEHADLLLADTILAELLVRPLAGLDLIGRTSLRPYVEREDVVSAVAEDLGVDLLIEGTVIGLGEGDWRAELRLLSVPNGRVLWSSTVEGGREAPMEIRSVAESMAEALVEAWPELRDRLAEGRASD